MDVTFNFLLQATRVLNYGKYNENELNMIKKFLLSLDSESLNTYNSTQTIITHKNDLELYLEIIEALIYIYEINESYEDCHALNQKKIEAIKILQTK
jgi:hypothetical protein